MEGKLRWYVLYGLLAGLCAALLVMTYRQGQELQALRQEVQETGNSVMDRVNVFGGQVNAFSRDVRQARAARMPQAVSFRNASIYPPSRVLTVELEVDSPERNMGNTHVGLCQEGEPFALAWQESWFTMEDTSGIYAATLKIPLEEDMRLDVRLEDDTVLYSGSVQALLPLRRTSGGGIWHYNIERRTFYITDLSIQLTDPEGQEARVQEGAFRLYRNGELALEDPEEGGQDGLSLPCEPGDVIRLTYVCKDETGLGWEFPLMELLALSWDDMRQQPISGAPTLIWPE